VATASVAAADVSFSGYGRFGVKSTSTDAATVAATKTSGAFTYYDASADAIVEVADDSAAVTLADEDHVIGGTNGTAASTTAKKTTTDITNRMEINVAASFEASNGITYGGKMRVRSDGGNAHFNAPQFTMSSGGLTLVVGNNSGQMYTGGAGGYAVGLTGLGFEGDAFTGFDEYSSYGAGNQGVDVNYSVGSLSMGVSHSKTTENTQAAVSYTAGSVTLAAGMQDGKAKADDYSVASVDYAFGNGSVGLKYGDNNGTKTTVLGGSFDIAAATSLTAFVKDTNTASVKNVYGIGVSHDLGGASLKAGYVDNADGSVADFGIVFNF